MKNSRDNNSKVSPNNFNDNGMKPCIVCHSGARDRYQVALALYEAGILGYLVTDDYFLRKEYRGLIPRKHVKISYKALICVILTKLHIRKNMNFQKDNYIGRLAGKLARKHDMNLLSYNKYAYSAFKSTEAPPSLSKRYKMIFQYHPHFQLIKDVYKKEIAVNPKVKNQLLKEDEFHMSEAQENQQIQEVKMADCAIVASTFTKVSLEYVGFNKEQIIVVPYGVDIQKYSIKQYNRSTELRLIYVGQFRPRKGMSYLLEAVKELEDEGYKLSLTLIGRSFEMKEEILSYQIKNLRIMIGLSDEEKIKELKNADVFTFPSLIEGFAFVLTEAMSVGLPVISTTHTCARDLVVNGEEGFVIEPFSKELVKDAIKYFLNHPEQIEVMGRKAHEKAKGITWKNFRNSVVEAVVKFCE